MSLGVFSTSNYLVSAAPVTAVPFTLFAYVYPTSLPSAAVMNLLSLCNTTDDQRWGMFLSTAGAPNLNRVDGSGTTNTPVGSGTLSAAAWGLVIGRVTSANSVQIDATGCATATNATSRTPNTPTRLSLGVRASSSIANALTNGYLGPCGVYSSALSDANVTSLIGGAHPFTVSPSTLVMAVGLWDKAEGLKDFACVGSTRFNASVTGSLSEQSTDPLALWRPLPRRRSRLILPPPTGWRI